MMLNPARPNRLHNAHHPSDYSPSLSKKAVSRQVAAVIAAADEVQQALTLYKRGLKRFGSLIDSGTAVPEALQTIEGNVGGKPRLIPDTLADFEGARNELRTAIVALAIDQGMSGSGLARRLGVSRQLVSRIAAQRR